MLVEVVNTFACVLRNARVFVWRHVVVKHNVCVCPKGRQLYYGYRPVSKLRHPVPIFETGGCAQALRQVCLNFETLSQIR